jgi:hypothetical protein
MKQKKPGFFERLFKKVDESLIKKAEENKSGCSCNDDPKCKPPKKDDKCCS